MIRCTPARRIPEAHCLLAAKPTFDVLLLAGATACADFGAAHSRTLGDDDGADSDENGDRRESWFAGGERRYVSPLSGLPTVKPIHPYSGISVENPDRARAPPGGNMVRDLLRRAAQCVHATPSLFS